MARLAAQVLALCQRAGLVGLGDVAVDDTKLRANASKHKAISYARMVQAEAELAREVADWLDRAQQDDAAEDAAHGERRGDEPPEWMQSKRARLARIRTARAELEAEAKAAAAAKPAPPIKPDGTPHLPRGRRPVTWNGTSLTSSPDGSRPPPIWSCWSASTTASCVATAASRRRATTTDKNCQTALSNLSGHAPTYPDELARVEPATRKWPPNIADPGNLFSNAVWWDIRIDELTVCFQEWLLK